MNFSFTPLLAFLGVLACIPLALWLLKRTPLGGGAGHGPMRLVATLPLGPNQRLLTVEVGSGDDRRWLVLGATAAGISTLHTLAPQAESPAPAGNVLPFAQLLARARTGAAAAPEGRSAP
jgi:flagellar protein FliO/FliZ